MTLWQWTLTIQQTRQYPLTLLQGVIHLAFLWLFYTLAVSTWTPAVRRALWRTLAWSGAFVVVYGWLQVAKLDQFYLNIDRKQPAYDLLVGTIGNPSHFGLHLALLLPVFLLRRWWAVSVATAVLVGLTRSASGCAAAWLAVTVWLCWTFPTEAGGIALASLGLAVAALVTIALWWPGFLDLHGRWAAWRAFSERLVERPIAGWGLGAVMEASRGITSGVLHKWRHVHCEPFQVWLETGAIGVGLLGLALVDWMRTVWRLPKTPELGMFVAIAAAFAVGSLVSFPAHLWLLGSFGLMAYAGVYRLAQEAQG